MTVVWGILHQNHPSRSLKSVSSSKSMDKWRSQEGQRAPSLQCMERCSCWFPVPGTAVNGLNHHLSGKTSTELMPLCGQPMAQTISQASFQFFLCDWSLRNKRDPQMLLAKVMGKPQFISGFHLLRLFQKEDNPTDFWMQPLVVHCLPGSVQVEVNCLKYLHGMTLRKGVSAAHANQTDTWAKSAVSFHLMQQHQGLIRGWSDQIWNAGLELEWNMGEVWKSSP